MHDTAALNAFLLAVAPLIISLAITISGIVYLTLLSWQLVVLTAGASLLGLGAQWIAQRYGLRGVTAARDGEDLLQKYYEAIATAARVALQRITQLTEQFTASEPRLLEERAVPASLAMDRIELRDLCYTFAARASSRRSSPTAFSSMTCRRRANRISRTRMFCWPGWTSRTRSRSRAARSRPLRCLPASASGWR